MCRCFLSGEANSPKRLRSDERPLPEDMVFFARSVQQAARESVPARRSFERFTLPEQRSC